MADNGLSSHPRVVVVSDDDTPDTEPGLRGQLQQLHERQRAHLGELAAVKAAVLVNSRELARLHRVMEDGFRSLERLLSRHGQTDVE